MKIIIPVGVILLCAIAVPLVAVGLLVYYLGRYVIVLPAISAIWILVHIAVLIMLLISGNRKHFAFKKAPWELIETKVISLPDMLKSMK